MGLIKKQDVELCLEKHTEARHQFLQYPIDHDSDISL
jgi:hypothetical protein